MMKLNQARNNPAKSPKSQSSNPNRGQSSWNDNNKVRQKARNQPKSQSLIRNRKQSSSNGNNGGGQVTQNQSNFQNEGSWNSQSRNSFQINERQYQQYLNQLIQNNGRNDNQFRNQNSSNPPFDNRQYYVSGVPSQCCQNDEGLNGNSSYRFKFDQK